MIAKIGHNGGPPLDDGEEYNLNNLPQIVDVLKRNRKAAKITHANLEYRSGVSYRAFFYWGSRERDPQISNIVAVADVLGFEIIMRRKPLSNEDLQE